MRRRAERGAALIMALLTVALATLLATRLLLATDLTIGLVEGRAAYAQALELTRGGVDYARAVLNEDLRRSAIDHPGEPWATPLPPVETPSGEGEGRMSGRIEDLQGRWNVNNLVANGGQIDAREQVCFENLLRSLELDPALAERVARHLLPAKEPAPGVVPLPRLILDLGELHDVPGIDARVVETLRPYITALPDVQHINVNTASDLVLVAVIPQLGRDAARRLIARRERLPFKDEADFRAELSSAQRDAAAGISLAVRSYWFLIHANAMVGRAVARQRALVHRRGDGHWPRVIWRSYS